MSLAYCNRAYLEICLIQPSANKKSNNGEQKPKHIFYFTTYGTGQCDVSYKWFFLFPKLKPIFLSCSVYNLLSSSCFLKGEVFRWSRRMPSERTNCRLCWIAQVRGHHLGTLKPNVHRELSTEFCRPNVYFFRSHSRRQSP